MNNILVNKDVIDNETLESVKLLIRNSTHRYYYDKKRIYIDHNNNEIFNNIFSQLKGSTTMKLKEIECFMVKDNTSDDFSYEKIFCKEDEYIFDFHIVQKGKYPLIGNTPSYKIDTITVLLKMFLVKSFNNCEKICDSKHFEDFVYSYDFESTCKNCEYFVLSLLTHLDKNGDFILFKHLVEHFQHFFDNFELAKQEFEKGTVYTKNILDNLETKDGKQKECKEQQIQQHILLEMNTEKINSSFGNAFLQFAILNDPILRNYPLMDNQCISFPGNLIHKREPYEAFTDDKIIHILFKCVKNLKKNS